MSIVFDTLPTFADKAEWERWKNVDEYLAGQILEIADTGTANAVYSFTHGLGRKPVGVEIIRRVLASTPGGVVCYQLAADDDWTATTMNLRFTVANSRVLLRIY